MKYINPKNNEVLESDLTALVAKQIILAHAPISDSFAHDLTRKSNLSAGQIFWLIKKGEQYNPNKINKSEDKPKIMTGAGMVKIHELFQTAKSNGLKRPKIRLSYNENKVVLSLAPDTGRNQGFIYIKENSIYAGKISPLGVYSPVSNSTPELKNYLQSFSDNPAEAAKVYGQKTGNCCFCALELTDKRSVTAGYGPICAAKYGLPWE
jgi:hypothetical protein